MGYRVKSLTAVVIAIFIWMPLEAQIRLDKGERYPIDTVDYSAFTVQTTAAALSNRQGPGMSAAQWGIGWTDKCGTPCAIRLEWGNTDFGNPDDIRFMVLSVMQRDSAVYTCRLTEGVNLYSGYNALNISFRPGALMGWSVGADKFGAVGEYQWGSEPNGATLHVFTQGSPLNLSTARLLSMPGATPVTPFVIKDDFPLPVQLSSSPEGVWAFLDRDNDPKWARPGGRYTLGIRRSDDRDSSWDIVYLDGAVTNAARWKPGSIKGRLVATPFDRHYNLLWIDAAFERLTEADECSASLSDDGAVLTLSFPLDHTTLRFYRPQ